MTVYFANQGNLDLALVTTMGISVKTTKSPIGYFGTGLKFAISTLLRTGHRIRIWTGGHWHTLSTQDRVVRGETFQYVCMDGEALPFVTTLGKNWEVWQAYRELASNARDEVGHVVTADPLRPESFDTCIVVDGEGIELAHKHRSEVFCESRVVHHLPGVAEAREGQSHFVYYRGVRIHTLRVPSLYTWNLLGSVDLTEDRTMRYSWAPNQLMGQAIAASDDQEFISECCAATDERLEHSASFDYVTQPSEAFMASARRLAPSGMMSTSARRLWEKTAPSVDVYEDALLDAGDLRAIEEAEELVLAIDPDYLLEARYVVSLGDGCFGLVRGDDVMISHTAISMGVDFLAATLYEEYLHRQHGFADESRKLQNHLFQQLVRLARRVP